MALTKKDVEMFDKFRVAPELLEKAGIQRITDAEAREMGFRLKGQIDGLLFPYMFGGKCINARIRRDKPEMDNGKAKGKYVAMRKRARCLYAVGGEALMTDTSCPIVFVEAEKSVLAMSSLFSRVERPIVPLGTSGVWGWRNGGGQPVPDFNHIAWAGRRVIICFDSNVLTNPNVQAAERALIQELQKRGADVRCVRLPQEEGVNGPDDFIALHADAEFLQLLDTAEERRPDGSQENLEKTLQELAKLDPVSYDRQREEVARRLGIRVSTLDTEVTKRRPLKKEEKGILFEEIEPWNQPVDGAELLDEIRNLYRKYVVLAPGADVANALWTMHTYCLEAASVSPILCIMAPEKRSGKTTLLEIHQAVDYKALPAANITGASLFRIVEAQSPTLLIDEGETFLHDNEGLRGIINSGHRKATATILRCVGDDHVPTMFSTWGAKAIALNGNPPSTIEDRSIVTKMRRKTREEHVARFRFERVVKDATNLRRKLVRWAKDNVEWLSFHDDSEIPESLNDRAADCWRPLFAIADRVAGRWPGLARSAATRLSADVSDRSTGAQLLADIREVFDAEQTDRIPSDWIAARLVEMEERPWGEWKLGRPLSKYQLARLLDPFGIKPKTIRLNPDIAGRFRVDTAKGYERAQFEEAWRRYLSSDNPPAQSGTTSQPPPDVTLSVTSLTNESVTDSDEGITEPNLEDTTGICDEFESSNVTARSAPVVGCDVVTVENPVFQDEREEEEKPLPCPDESGDSHSIPDEFLTEEDERSALWNEFEAAAASQIPRDSA